MLSGVEDAPWGVAKSGTVIAVDGPAGAGKSTVSRALAARVGLPYVNTGLMYRAVTARALAAGVDPDDEPVLEDIARGIDFALRDDDGMTLSIDGRPPGEELSSPGVEAVVSAVSRHPRVRAVMRRAQRWLGAAGCVMEGRDIGSAVFPDADVKIFVSADPRVRAARRERERGDPTVGAAVATRDALDSQTNPLEPAPGAEVIDTTRLPPDEVVAEALAIVRAALGRRG
jgi:cytidylate kinase